MDQRVTSEDRCQGIPDLLTCQSKIRIGEGLWSSCQAWLFSYQGILTALLHADCFRARFHIFHSKTIALCFVFKGMAVWVWGSGGRLFVGGPDIQINTNNNNNNNSNFQLKHGVLLCSPYGICDCTNAQC